ncbi:MAG: SDR family oxidoreductase [Bacteroidetes bacterium]|jgi:3-oxoacyl-[acyl-carrier protein] reductase|nr:SDR family oxidoreductase [Bacteroidota bacterium]
MDLSLKNKTALVGGSTQGIGRATALELAEMGARVILLARNEEKLKKVLAELRAVSDLEHEFLVADFTLPNQVKEAVVKAVDSYGAINILVNNTGGPPAGKAIDADPEDYLAAFNMHLICNQLITQVVVPGMKESGYGRIVNIISTSVKQPLPNLGVSNTIRGAVANWSKTLSLELGEFGITVNNVLPGATATSRLDAIAERKAEKSGNSIEKEIELMGKKAPLNRVAKPGEVANGVCFLASPAASYISGINLPVDGGRTGSL